MNKVRLVTYNIDGLPDKLDLADLPWLFKPIAWVYKWIKKTTLVPINDGTDRQAKTKEISEYLATLNADIIAVQEDFNYHKELMSSLKGYKGTTHTGDISLKNLFSKTEWRPLPRLKTDGLNLLTNNNVSVLWERIFRWNTSNGYISHANDKLTHKGFRHYCCTVKGVNIDLYVLHMDADFYHPENCPDVSKDIKARKKQLKQLIEYIQKKNSINPVIIVGDTNSTEDYEWDRENIQLLLDCGFTEAKPGENSVDRLFYKDGIYNKVHEVKAELGRGDLSDHRPLIVDLEICKDK